MQRPTATAFAAALILCAAGAQAQSALPADELKAMLAEVSPARIEARIRKLVAFGTRHTLSDIASDTRGIGAARRWITAELAACAKATGAGCRQVGGAELHRAGRQPRQPARRTRQRRRHPARPRRVQGANLVVSGHYDSRNSDVMDSLGEARRQ